MRQGAINQLPRLLRARQDKVYLTFFTPTVCVGPMGLATVSIGPPSAFPQHMHIERKRRKYRVCEAEIRTEQVVFLSPYLASEFVRYISGYRTFTVSC